MPDQYKYLEAFIDDQRANGKYSFTIEDLRAHIHTSANALNKSL